MTHPMPRSRATPREMNVTEFKSNIMDALDDARAGHVVVIQRRDRPVAALVPVEVAEAYERKAELPDHIRLEIADAVDRFRTDVEDALSKLDGAVRGQAADEQSSPDAPAERIPKPAAEPAVAQ